ncbi:transposon Ty3-I Gag-Pol polyprotein [Trichonephila clavipes]|nr:transposon Ty3-I Gag-Pol polyprotein [Trichonephila clavipes]
MRYCRERKAVFDNSRNRRRNFDDVGTEEEIRRPNSSRRFTPSPTRADPQYVVTDPRRHIADPVSRQAVGARKTKGERPSKEKVLFADAKSVMLKVADGNFVRPIGKCVLRVRINNRELPFEFIVLSHCSHDVILGWDFLEASQAVIDCGQNELVLEDICRDSTAPDAWNLYATRDYTLKPHSLTRITVSGYQTRGDINVVLDGSKHLLFEKNIATPSMVSTYQKQAIRTTPEIFWAFHDDRQVDSREDECETQDFTGDHAPINQRAYRVSPTERRIIHEEVQKMLDEGIVQPSESPWSSPIVLVRKRTVVGVLRRLSRFIKGFCYLAEPLQSLLKSGVEFHWGPEEVEAFNSLKKALTSDQYWGCTTKELLQKSILMQAGTVSGCPSTNSE